MINELRKDINLSKFEKADCSENDISVNISPKVTQSNKIIYCMDSFYHSLHLAQIPPTTDCLIIIKSNTTNKFAISLVELKNLKSATFDKKNVHNKFGTVINDFMKIKYKHIFLDPQFDIIELNLFFVTDCYNYKDKGYTDSEIRKLLNGTRIENLLLMKPFEFRGKIYQINYKVPDPLIHSI